MVPLEILILYGLEIICVVSYLVEALWHIADSIKIARANLSDVHVNHQGVPAVDFKHLLRVLSIDVNVVVGVNMLVRSDSRWLSVDVSGRLHVVEAQISVLLLFINAKVEVRFGHHFLVLGLRDALSCVLVLKFEVFNLLGDDLVDALLDSRQVLA